MTNKFVKFSEGLRNVLSSYCDYRHWSTVAPKTAEDIRLLIERAGSVEETLDGLDFFFNSKYADEWVQENRPNLGIPFLIEAWDRYEIWKAEVSAPRRDYISRDGFNEYRAMRIGA